MEIKNSQQAQSLKNIIEKSEDVKITTETDGFKVISEEINNRIADLDVILNTTIDPSEAFACIKEKKGLLFFISSANEIIDRGKAAVNQLASS